MEGILKDFNKLVKDDVHQKFNELYKYILTFEINGESVKGEGLSKDETGSRNWIRGLKHTFTKKENSYCYNGIQFTGIKPVDKPPEHRSKPEKYDYIKEAFVVSRYAHSFAHEFLKEMNEEEKSKLAESLKIDKHELIGKYASTVAKSVNDVAHEVLKLNEDEKEEK